MPYKLKGDTVSISVHQQYIDITRLPVHSGTYLVFFQSLVCSCHASSSLLHDVLYDLGESVEVKGRDSLQILCLAQTDPLSTTDKILQTFPLVLPQFSKQMLGEDSHKVYRYKTNM